MADRRPDVSAEVAHVSDARRLELFGLADFVVLPYTTFASQSGVVADAYQSVTPMLVSDVGALGPTVRDDQSGWVVPPSQAARLAETILQVLEQPSELGAKRQAIVAVAPHYDYATVGCELRRIYQEVLQRAQAGWSE